MSLRFPWTIHEALIALYPARMDGFPLAGPSGSSQPLPLLEHQASLKIDRTIRPGIPTGYDYTGSASPIDDGYSISADIPEGAWTDEIGRSLSRLEACGHYCLVVRFEDDAHSGEWTVWRFYYVTLETDSLGDVDQRMQRGLRLKATYRQEEIGTGEPPELRPFPYGEVEWICGPIRVTAMTYLPETGVWTSTSRNRISAADDAAPFIAIAQDEAEIPFVSYYVSRPENPDQPTLAGDPEIAGTPLTIGWQHTLALRILADDSLEAAPGFSLQTNGTPEPILMLPRARLFDEPIVVFRYLRRVYATICHGTIAIPSLNHALPPATHEPDFRIGRLRILPFGAFFPAP